jgi:tetratricopeptide (TPR) repeat protein
VLGRASYFLTDYPITGAGLASFPGLYSQYVLVIPYPFLTETYNTFLDVGIEQGVIAGTVLLFLYLGSVFLVSWSIANDPSHGSISMRGLALAALFVAIVHGCFYDYLYNGNGTALLFYPLGMAMAALVRRHHFGDKVVPLPKALPRLNLAVVTFPAVALILMLGMNFNQVISHWYSNLGALQMSKAELNNFPANQWATSDMVYRLEPAESTLRVALQYEPQNQTANYRLGLISMLRQDFQSAVAHLQIAYQEAPKHRGIIKNLGYAYAWHGEFDKAQVLLRQIPEAQKEMGIYIGWWDTQGRPDLSENASIMVSRLGAPPQ